MRKLISFLLFGNFLIFSLVGDVKLHKGKYLEYESYVLENEYVRAEIIPEANGRLVRFFYKPLKAEYFHPYQEQNTAKCALLELAGSSIEHNFGGMEDWFYENGVLKTQIVYRCKILETTPDKVVLELSRPASGEKAVFLTKYITLKSASTVLDVKLIVQNNSSAPSAYWAHSSVNLGGDFKYEALNILPRKKISNETREMAAQKDPSRKNAFTKVGNTNQKHIGIDLVTNVQASMYTLPAQRWFAVYEPSIKLATAQVARPASLISEELIFYRFCGVIWDNKKAMYLGKVPYMSQEIMFPSTPGGTKKTFGISIIFIPGIKDLHYVNEDIAIGLKRKNDGKVIAVIAVNSFIPSGSIKFYVGAKPEEINLTGMKPGDLREINLGDIGGDELKAESVINGVKNNFNIMLNIKAKGLKSK